MHNSYPPSLLLVGAGNWGKHLARNFHSLGALHTICDTNTELVSTYSSLYPQVKLSTHYETALKDQAIDKVAIAAPAILHYHLAKLALEAGKDVYVEKPLCLNSQEAEELVALAKQRHRILMVGHLLQYHPCIQRLQEIVAKGDIGKLHSISATRLNLGIIRTEENALWSLAPHDLSIILSLCGNSLPTCIHTIGQSCLLANIPDLAMISMQFPNGLKAHIHVSWLHPFKEQKLVIIGSKGMIVFDDTKPWQEKLALYKNAVTWVNGNTPQASPAPLEFQLVPQAEPLHEECLHFLLCCQNRATPKTDGAEGLRVLKVLQGAQASLSQNGALISCIPSSSAPYFSHETAIIHPKATIGEGSKIWHFSHIMEHTTLGAKCNIGQNVVICPGAILGSNVKVQNNVSIYAGVVCEDDVFLGPSMVFTNVINPRSSVNRRDQYQTTRVKQGASIGANATIVCGVELGQYCFIGAGAVVTKDVKPYALVVGNPAKQIGWISAHGHTLDLPLSTSNGEEQTAVCPLSEQRYVLKTDHLFLIPD